MQINKKIQVFEWEKLAVGQFGFTQTHFNALVEWQEKQKYPYFKIGYNKIIFTQWVGVLQIKSLVIEVLPKIDSDRYSDNFANREESTGRWKNVLIEMLRKTGRLRLRTSDATNLAVRSQSLFDLYFQSYLDEVETLIHRGLVKKYRREQKNRTALKGKLLFQKQIKFNTVHKERFFTEAAEFDRQNIWNEILLAALYVTSSSAQSGLIRARAQNLVLNFPDWPEKTFTPYSFERLVYGRKTEDYKHAITLAKLILLHLNPQVSAGKEKVVAILFDMNRLWEEWLLATYRSSFKNDNAVTILGKKRTGFWKSQFGKDSFIETDILIEDNRSGTKQYIILDAKWKCPKHLPTDDEIKQMFAYNLMWNCSEAWLIYPNPKSRTTLHGRFIHTKAGSLGMTFVDIFDNNKHLCQKLELPTNQYKQTY